MEAGSSTKNNVDKKTSDEDEDLSLEMKGHKFFQDSEYEQAFNCYNSAIELDDSNLELLLYRAVAYLKLNEYSKCLSDAEKFVALKTGTDECNSVMMFNALKLITECMILGCPDSPENREKLEETFIRAMRTDASPEAIERLVEAYNRWRYNCKTSSPGLFFYMFNSRQEEIEQFTRGIEQNRSDSLAFAYRAVWFAEKGDHEQELISDVQNCIDLDFRNAHYLASKAKQFMYYSRILPCLRLIKALGASIETYKRSAGKLFPKLLDDKPLNESEIKRFEKFCSIHVAPVLWGPNRDYHPDALPDPRTDTSDCEGEEAEKLNKRKQNEQALEWKEKGDKFYERKQFKAALNCYNKAIELDKSNLDLLICRVQVYYDTKKWARCISEADKLIAAHKSKHKKCKCMPVFRAWKLMGMCVEALKVGFTFVALEAFEKALQIEVPVDEIEFIIMLYNVIRKGLGNPEASVAALTVGDLFYFLDNSAEAIKHCTKAIEHCKVESRAYAHRALCYAEDDHHEQELISDVKESLDLDYRTIEFFLIKCTSEFSRFPTARLRLLKALSLCEETFKQSAGRIFPRIRDNKPLDRMGMIRYLELAVRWRPDKLEL